MDWQDDHITEMAASIRKLAQHLSDASAEVRPAGQIHKLASLYTQQVYTDLIEQEVKRAAELPEDIEHPFRHYTARRVGGAAFGGAIGALAGGGGGKSLVGGLAGAFAGEKIGEAQAILDHYHTVNRFDEMGVKLPDAVRHPHFYGLAAHQAAIQAMKEQPSPFALPPGSY